MPQRQHAGTRESRNKGKLNHPRIMFSLRNITQLTIKEITGAPHFVYSSSLTRGKATGRGLKATPRYSHRHRLSVTRLSGVGYQGIGISLMVLMTTRLGNLTMGICHAELHNGLTVGNIHRQDDSAHCIVDILTSVGRTFSADGLISITDSVVAAFVLVFTRQLWLVIRAPTRPNIIICRILTSTLITRLAITNISWQRITTLRSGVLDIIGFLTLRFAERLPVLTQILNRSVTLQLRPLVNAIIGVTGISVLTPLFCHPGDEPVEDTDFNSIVIGTMDQSTIVISAIDLGTIDLSTGSIKSARIFRNPDPPKISCRAITACLLPEQYRFHPVGLSTGFNTVGLSTDFNTVGLSADFHAVDTGAVDRGARSIKNTRLCISFNAPVIVGSMKTIGCAAMDSLSGRAQKG
ncbi:hypothetical protein N7504_008113 [Penicillium tannophilum]|nr:hypothetical protein N7504_008113 [Penicillium tannophilum]